MANTVLILGASGKVGGHAAEAFWNGGWTVREYVRGTDIATAAKGVDVIFNAMNPPDYHDWANQIPAITALAIDGARASGATVIQPGSVYNFGDTPGIWDETTPQRPVAKKGRIRVEMERAYADSGVRTIILRGGDFLDPARDDTLWGRVMLKGLLKGRITALGPVDARHAYAFLPDMARAAVALAERRDTLAAFEDVPFPGYAFTVVELRDLLADALGREIRIDRFPWWSMTLAAPFWEMAREFREMRYLNEVSHSLGGAKFARLVPGFRATPLRDGVLACLAQDILARLPRDIRPDETMRSGGEAVVPE